MKTLRGVLHQVDPNLNIIPGGVFHHERRGLSQQDWDKAAGVICKTCGREVFRSRNGLCLQCWEEENEFEIRDKTGVTEFLPRSVIMEIVKTPNAANEASSAVVK